MKFSKPFGANSPGATPSSTYFVILIIYFLDGTKVRKSLTVINLKVATNKKRKVDTESRIFQEKWTIDYFFHSNK